MLRLNFEIQNKILERYKFLNLGAASDLPLQQLNVVNDIEGKLSQLLDRIRQTVVKISKSSN